MSEETELQEEEIDVSKITGKSSGDLKGISIAGKIIGVLVILWLVSISYYAFAFFALGMMPAVAAFIIDKGDGKFASKTVIACNFIGISPFLLDIALTADKSMAAKYIMLDPITWLVVFGFSSVGWMLIWILPQITLIFFTVRADMKKNKILAEQDKLLDEWGEELKENLNNK